MGERVGHCPDAVAIATSGDASVLSSVVKIVMVETYGNMHGQVIFSSSSAVQSRLVKRSRCEE